LVVFADSVVFVATLWEKLPNLKLAIPLSEVKYSPQHRDVGILELPVLF
jgi:nitric oxide reductase